MKPIFSLAALAAALMLTACEHPRQAAQSTPPTYTPEMITEVKVKGPGQRAFFVAATYLDLLIMDQQIAALSDTITSLQSDAVAEGTLQSIRDQRAELDPKFESMVNADEASWENARRTYEAALRNLDASQKSARATYEK